MTHPPNSTHQSNFAKSADSAHQEMVFAFLCHSIGSPCRVLYSAVFGDDLQLAANEAVMVDSLRSIRKEQLMQVACRVQIECGFKAAAKDRLQQKVKEDYLSGGSASEDPTAEKGLFRLSAGDPFTTPKVVIWIVKDGCAYVMVCELDENRILAEFILNTIMKFMLEHVTSHEQGNAELMLKPEKAAAILHQFLPNGQLIFMNHKVIAQYKKQLDKLLSTL